MVRKALEDEEAREKFEAKLKEIEARSMRSLDEGTWTGPIVPIGLRPPEKRKKSEAKNDS